MVHAPICADKAKLHIDHVTEMWAKEKATRAEKQSADLAKAEAETEHSSGTKAVGDTEAEKSEEKSEDESEDEDEEKEEEEEREIDDDEPQEESDEARPRATTKKVNAKKAAERKSATAEDEEGVRYVGASQSRDRGQSRPGAQSPDVCLSPPGT
jgi:hypothetical protein